MIFVEQDPNLETVNQRMATGIVGLDEILLGGFVPRRAYLLHGSPGSGKTMLGLHFLTTGAKQGESTLFITMGEPAEQIKANARSVGFDLGTVKFLDLAPSADFFSQVQSYDIFSPADVEREPTTERITSEVNALQPVRVFVDAVTHLRYLSNDNLSFRRQVHSFLRFLVDKGATVLFTSEGTTSEPDDDLQYMSDGIIKLHHEQDLRTISVTKFRGSDFMVGEHSMRLGSQGIEVFPRLLPMTTIQQDYTTQIISSGVSELDALLHGGLERGTITIISGPTGVGKTTIGMQFMKEAAARGERSVVYCFEEWREMLIRRSQSIGTPINEMLKRGTLEVVQVEPLRYTPDEFARMVREEAETNHTTIVMLDSISGYRLSVRGDNLVRHLHALGKYLQSMSVAAIFISETESIIGGGRATEIGVNYIADSILFLRYLEMKGELRRVIGVLKKRLSDFEKVSREFEITKDGLMVGQPLTDLRGVLTVLPYLNAQDESHRS